MEEGEADASGQGGGGRARHSEHARLGSHPLHGGDEGDLGGEGDSSDRLPLVRGYSWQA